MTTTTARRDQGSTAPRRSRDQLLTALIEVDEHGWDSQAGRDLLLLVRRSVVAPQLRHYRLTGAAADQAESSAWAATWRTLTAPSLREASSPWGILWAAAGRALADETIATAYATRPRTGWKIRAQQRRAAAEGAPASGGAVQVSLEVLLEAGLQSHLEIGPPSTGEPMPMLDEIAAALVVVGWTPQAARATLLSIADRSRRRDGHVRLVGGWRAVAADAGIPCWQARRLTAVLLGLPGWPGLLERAASSSVQEGVAASFDALRSTLHRHAPSPHVLAARPAPGAAA